MERKQEGDKEVHIITENCTDRMAYTVYRVSISTQEKFKDLCRTFKDPFPVFSRTDSHVLRACKLLNSQ